MPNRIIKESICTSEDIAKLSVYAEVLFYRLMVKADDFGAYFGNPTIVKNTCFPLKNDGEVSSEDVKAWLQELHMAGLITLYKAEDGRTYLQFNKWKAHQQTRATKRKFPELEGRNSSGEPVYRDASQSASASKAKWGIRYDNEP